MLFESQTMTVYNVSLDDDKLLDLFAKKWTKVDKSLPIVGYSGELTNQLAVLHYTFISNPNPDRMRQVLVFLVDSG